MAVDLKRVVEAAVNAALQEPSGREASKKRGLPMGTALLAGAGLVTVARLLASRKGLESLQSLRNRIADLDGFDPDDEGSEAWPEGEEDLNEVDETEPEAEGEEDFDEEEGPEAEGEEDYDEEEEPEAEGEEDYDEEEGPEAEGEEDFDEDEEGGEPEAEGETRTGRRPRGRRKRSETKSGRASRTRRAAATRGRA